MKKEKETHVPKKIITADGREKTVYERTPETDRAIENYRMGFFAKYEPLDLSLFDGKLKEPQLIIQAPYEIAKRVIRTRLGLDRRPHRVLTGSTLLQYYFANDASQESYRDGFATFKQFYLLFGYSESTNRRLHEVIVETLFTRYQNDDHFWLVIPRSLDTQAAQWGPALLNLKTFPSVRIGEGSVEGPVSVANPLTTAAVGEPVAEGRYQDSSYTPDGLDSNPPPLSKDPSEERKRKRDRDKWNKS